MTNPRKVLLASISSVLMLSSLIATVALLTACTGDSADPEHAVIPGQDRTLVEMAERMEMMEEFPWIDAARSLAAGIGQTVGNDLDLEAAFRSMPWSRWRGMSADQIGIEAIEHLARASSPQTGSNGPTGPAAFHLVHEGVQDEPEVDVDDGIEFAEPTGLERARAVATGRDDTNTVTMRWLHERYVCWDPQTSEQRSFTSEHALDVDAQTDDGPEQHRRVTSGQLTQYTDGSERQVTYTTVDGHTMGVDTGRMTTGTDPASMGAGDAEATVDGDRITYEFPDGASWWLECPPGGRCVDEVVDQVGARGGDLVDQIRRDFARARRVWTTSPPDRPGGSDFCLDLEVAPASAAMEPDGNRLELTSTVRDWKEDEVTSAIVGIEGARLGTISPELAPTGPDGTTTATYTSDDRGEEHLEVSADHSFYRRSTAATIHIGAPHVSIADEVQESGGRTTYRWYSCGGPGGRWYGEVEFVSPEGTFAGGGSFLMPDDPKPGSSTVASWEMDGVFDGVVVTGDFRQTISIGGVEEDPTLIGSDGTLTVTVTMEGRSFTTSQPLDPWEASFESGAVAECEDG